MNTITLHITFSNNNIKINLINNNKVFLNTTSGKLGFKNIQKKSPFACISLIRYIITVLIQLKIQYININIIGINCYRNLILNTILKNSTIKIITITENSKLSYNGCKYNKKF